MIGVDKIGEIRRAYFEQHRSIKEIVRTLSVSRATVRKVVRGKKTEFKYERGVQPSPKLGDWVEVLTEILHVARALCYHFATQLGSTRQDSAGTRKHIETDLALNFRAFQDGSGQNRIGVTEFRVRRFPGASCFPRGSHRARYCFRRSPLITSAWARLASTPFARL